MQVPLIIHADKIITFLRPYGKDLNLKIGDIVRAEVINVMNSGDVALRVSQKNGENSIIVAKSDIPLAKGATVLFKVAASDSEIKLQFMGTASEGNKTVQINEESLPQRVLRMLSEFAGSKLKPEELKLMDEIFKALPDRIKTAFPEFRALERIMPEIEKVNSEILKKSLEESGVLLETKLKLAVQEQGETGTADRLNSLLSGSDNKLELLKLKAALQDEHVLDALKRAGIRPTEVSGTVDKLIKNLEYFQLTSQVNDAVYTFLPLTWQELREGELSFRKNRDGRGESYTCDINLDMEASGKLSISVTLYEGAFYVTFYAENTKLKSMIEEGRGLMEDKFSAADLLLKAVNITQKQGISFGAKKEQGLNIKV